VWQQRRTDPKLGTTSGAVCPVLQTPFDTARRPPVNVFPNTRRPSLDPLAGGSELNVTETFAGGQDGARETASERPQRWMTVRMPAGLRDAVEAQAKLEGSSLSLVIRNALAEHVGYDDHPSHG